MKHTVIVLTLVFVATSGANWLWGMAALFIYLFVCVTQFLFTPRT